jgi:serine/threonine protein kinase
MADVYAATDEALERQVAVKVLRPVTRDEQARARFVGEARLLAGLSHSGLVTVLDAGFDAEHPYLVMELVHGQTLAQVCGAGPCDAPRVESVGAQVAEALAFVHGRGIIHRDVKPANVLVGAEGRAKLADFGIARLVDQSAGYTRTGFAMASVPYASPEQVRGETVTAATDVYSLGLVLLEALTGRREYAGTGLDGARERLGRPPHLSPELPEHWRGLIAAMTATDPAARPSAAEVAARIRTRQTEPIPTTRAMPTDPAPAPAIDRAGDALLRQVHELGRLAANLSREQQVLIGVGLTMALLLVVAALAGG